MMRNIFGPIVERRWGAINPSSASLQQIVLIDTSFLLPRSSAHLCFAATRCQGSRIVISCVKIEGRKAIKHREREHDSTEEVRDHG